MTFFLGILLAVSPLAVLGQSGRTELFGRIADVTGLPLPGVRVSAVDRATGLAFTASSAQNGAWNLLALPPGEYDVTAAKEGFRTLRRDGLVLRAGDRVALDLALAVGEISQVLDVSAGAPLLQTGKATLGFLLDSRQTSTLPLDGRTFVPLIALSPGVTLPPGASFPRINGSRPRVSEYLYDGISVLQPEPGQVAYYPVIDAVEEFHVETNSYSAEFGRSNGGVIQVVQKSGTNEFHGTLFEFLRNEKLNARNLFALAGPKPLFRRNQYGFVLGGPVQKNRTFFFADWQGTRFKSSVTRASTVPSRLERQGVFRTPVFDPATTRATDSGYARDPFPGGAVPVFRFDPAAARLAVRYPLPDTDGAANNFHRSASETTEQDQFDVRLDRYMGVRHRIFSRYSWWRDLSSPAAPLPDGSGAITSNLIGDTRTRADSGVAEYTATLTPAAVNQLRGGYTRRGFGRTALAGAGNAGIPDIPLSAFPDVLPTVQPAGYQQLGPSGSANSRFSTSVTQVLDTLSWVRGAHSIKAGTDLRVEHLDVLQPPYPSGLFGFTPVLTAALSSAGTPRPGTGNSLAGFLLGQVQSFDLDVQRETLQPRAHIAEFFVQDDCRASRRLSVSLGVRYTLNFPSTEARDRGAVFNLSTRTLDFLGRNGFPRSVRDLEKTNFGPRAGIAYKLGESWTARAGYGLTWIEQAGITTPFTTPLFPYIQTISERSQDNLHPAFTLSEGPNVGAVPPSANSGLGQGVFAVQRDNGSGYAQQWNATLQHVLGESWSVEAAYAGSKLTRLGVPDVNINQLTADQLRLGPALTELVANPFYGQIPANLSLGGPLVARQQLLRPYPQFTTVALYRNNVGHSTYHSFQARVEKRYSHSLLLTASYTFSRLIDDAGAVFDSAILTGPAANFQAADSFNRRLEKDVSTGNIPRVFAAGFVWEIPVGKAGSRWPRPLFGNWQLAGIARLQSGSPLAVTQATNLNAFAGFGIQRPNRLRDPSLPAGQRTLGRYFDTSAFTLAPQFTLGNSSRNPLTGPGYQTLDLMLAKTIPLRERARIEFRMESFNTANTPPLGNPNTSFGTPAFGSITSALDPRVFEAAVKVMF